MWFHLGDLEGQTNKSVYREEKNKDLWIVVNESCWTIGIQKKIVWQWTWVLCLVSYRPFCLIRGTSGPNLKKYTEMHRYIWISGPYSLCFRWKLEHYFSTWHNQHEPVAIQSKTGILSTPILYSSSLCPWFGWWCVVLHCISCCWCCVLFCCTLATAFAIQLFLSLSFGTQVRIASRHACGDPSQHICTYATCHTQIPVWGEHQTTLFGSTKSRPDGWHRLPEGRSFLFCH